MCRKTVIVELLSNGTPIDKIADFIGHTSTDTTMKYYAELEKKKHAQLDKDFFDSLFNFSLPEEIKIQFNKKEKTSLMKELKSNTRETPEGHGYCIKHVSFGPCQKKSCVGCKLLITGPQKLPKWYKLYEEQKNYISELENEYLNQGITDFQGHRIYQNEINLLEIYKDTITKTQNFAEKEGITYEKFTPNNKG